MSVLKEVMDERATWATQQEELNKKNQGKKQRKRGLKRKAWYGVFLLLGILVILNRHSIIDGLTKLFNCIFKNA